jgi:cytoskeletal protein CcmA (bactofilin family)
VLQIQKTPEMREAEITLISEGTALEGTLELASVARVHGSIRGKLVGSPGSLVVLASQSTVEGNIEADTLWVEGFVRGQIHAATRVILSPTARVVGDISSPRIEIDPGAYFEGRCRMEKLSEASPGSGTNPPSS